MERIESLFRTLVAVVIALIASGCGDARMASGSMEPTIKRGERVKVNYGAYAMDGPQRWDVVAFEPPEAPKFLWIFRVVAMPGEKVSFDKGEIVVNGQVLAVPERMVGIKYLEPDHAADSNAISSIAFPYVVPVDHYFLLGDNSANANDSRFWGGLPRSNILGKVKGK
jgi:signal peptidase I